MHGLSCFVLRRIQAHDHERLLLLPVAGDGGRVVADLEDATHAVLRHKQQEEFQRALELGTVSVVRPEWVLYCAASHQLQDEVCAGLLCSGHAPQPLASMQDTLQWHLHEQLSRLLLCCLQSGELLQEARYPACWNASGR
jgi:hypothetical protein